MKSVRLQLLATMVAVVIVLTLIVSGPLPGQNARGAEDGVTVAQQADPLPPAPPELAEHAAKLLQEYLDARKVVAGRSPSPWDQRDWFILEDAYVKLAVDMRRKDAVPILIGWLRDPRTEVSDAGASILAGLGGDAAPAARALGEVLLKRKCEPALAALSNVGPSAAVAIPGIRARLMAMGAPGAAMDSREFDRVSGLLAGLGQPAYPVLAEALQARNEWLRMAAAKGLGSIGPEAASEAVPLLAKALADESRPVRYCAADSLGCLGAAARPALPALREVLKDPKRVTLHPRAAEAIYQVDGSTVDEVLPVLVDCLRPGNYADERETLDVIGRLGPAARPALPALLQCLKHENIDIRSKAALALGRIEPEPAQAVPPLHSALSDEHYRVRVAAALSLERIAPDTRKETIPVLVEGMRHFDSWRTEYIIPALARIGKDAVPLLIGAVGDKDYPARMWVVEALGQIGPEAAPAVDILLAASKDDDHLVRRMAAKALGRIGARKGKVISRLEEMVQDRYTLGAAATALYHLDPAAHNRHLDVYIANLKHGDSWNHVAAAEAVGRMGPAAKAAVPHLAKLRYYVSSRDVREAAEAALKKIRGSD